MKKSVDHILCTHVGSLARPRMLLETMREKENGRPYDAILFDEQVREAVADAVRRQVEVGIDIVTDGEMGKVGFLNYVKDRLSGFSAVDDEPLVPNSWKAEIAAFPDYYHNYFKKYSGAVAPLRALVCTGPVSYNGHKCLQSDIDNLKAALSGVKVQEAFMASTSPSGFGRNQYYSSDNDYIYAVADAMREEYAAIIEAGFLLQVDDPWLIEILSDPSLDRKSRHRAGMAHVEMINYAIRGLPEDKLRLHICYGLNHGPRLHDLPMADIVGFMLAVNAGAYSFEMANPRHYHEWRLWETTRLPTGKILMPGLIGHATNYVEHPEMIGELLVNYANLVGRENVIAAPDCGFSSRATFAPEVDPAVAWAKLRALSQGAAIATRKLWRGSFKESKPARL
jgi:5-methyltetrahydropteroyltriglutamate--homocysteine methyltransferase